MRGDYLDIAASILGLMKENMERIHFLKKFIITSAFFLTIPSAARADFSRHEHHGNFGWHGPRHCDGERSEGFDGRWSQPPRGYGYHWPRYSNSNSFGELRYDDSRFHQGVRNGELSWAEVEEIRDKRQDYVNDKVRFESDGWLSEREAEHLQDDLRDYHQSLSHELRDGEYRSGW